jgi:type II secretory pathway pseudopilin PulG
MTPSEIISMSIAGVALIVAWLARLDSKKSAEAAQESAEAAQRANDLMARQLELAEEEQKHQQQKDISESRPVFSWRSWGCIGSEIYYDFINQGALITNVKVNADGGLEGWLEPKDAATGQLAHLKFKGVKRPQHPDPFNFSIEFTDKLNWRRTLNYTVRLGLSGDLARPELVNN